MIPSKHHPPARPDVRPLVLLLILVTFAASMAWTARHPAEAGVLQTQPAATGPAATAQVAQVTATPTRFPEYLTNQDQTNGIILGSTILVLIIVIGTMTVIRHGERRSG